MSDLETYGKQILDGTIAALKGEYAAVPQSVKDVMPRVAALVAEGAVAGTLDGAKSANLKHSMAILANVKVGGQIALNELMLEQAANIIGIGLKFVRKIIGI